jgi:hypothetical protein
MLVPLKPSPGSEASASSRRLTTMAKPRGRPFAPGNKHGRGRPPGIRNKERFQGEKLLEQYEPHLTGKCISMAMEGNMPAMKICMSLLRPAGARRVQIALNKTRTLPEIDQTFERVLKDAGKGKLALGQAESISRVLEAKSRVLEKSDNGRLI